MREGGPTNVMVRDLEYDIGARRWAVRQSSALCLISCRSITVSLLYSEPIESYIIMVVGDFPLDGKIAVVTGGGSGMFLLASRDPQH